MAGSSFWARVAHRLGKPFRRARYKRLRGGLGETADREAVFTEIYQHNLWGEIESRSGAGSTLAFTAALREALPDLLRRHGVSTVLDAPCGDFHWMQAVRLPDGVAYIGADIVAPMVARLAQEHAAPGRRFVHLDLTTGPFPRHDLWLCRDCLFHLSYADIAKVWRAFLASPGQFALLTSHTAQDGRPVVNRDIATGDARPIDLTAAPFHLPAPLEAITDFTPPSHPRIVGLWSRAQLETGAKAFLDAY